ncbi:Transcription repressor OFP13 [Abeliophyllum distichum]|uniref:Transcription repressor n=1 Tax=Abeliophyllum distichum TaxID=126358 RepID=A0ABD1QZW2_9LAMI
MGKKLRFPFLFKAAETTSTTSWPWPTCANNPKTLSFRSHNEDIFKRTSYLDKVATECSDSTPDSFLEYDESLLNASQVFVNSHESSIETIIGGLTTADRLFFEPGKETSSILEEAKIDDNEFSFKESVVVMAMDSRDPFVDFRVSMEEMVEAHGLKHWSCLEELLACYLKVNDKSNHGFIVGAFVDLLVNFAFVSGSGSDSDSDSHSHSSAIDEPCCCSSTFSATHSFTSPLSFFSSTSFTSPCLSLDKMMEDEIIDKIVDNASSSSHV